MNGKPPRQIRLRERHTSFVLLLVAVLAEAALTIAAYRYEFGLPSAMAGIIILIILALFYDVELIVDYNSLHMIRGPGVFSTEIPLSSIQSMAIKPNRFLRSWLYNPFSENVLVLYLRDGRHLIIPAGDPKEIQGILSVKRM